MVECGFYVGGEGFEGEVRVDTAREEEVRLRVECVVGL